MKNKLAKILAVLCAACTTFSVAACANSADPDVNPKPGIDPKPPKEAELLTTYTDNSNSNSGTGFNKSLWYRNDLKLDMGDPMLVYDEDLQIFYAMGTRGGTQFECFSSENLTDWNQESLGGFAPGVNSWGRKNLWAPDIQKIGDKWYLYYTANYALPASQANYVGEDHCQIGVAVADSPKGPFRQWTGTNAYGKQIGEGDLPFYGMEHQTILDQNVFQDDDGQLYMYFSYDTQYSPEGERYTSTAEIWGVKMKDPVTWEMDEATGKPKIKRLIIAGYKSLDGKKTDIPWETMSPSFLEPMECVEGPYMIKNNGKYYLTYCANSFVDMEYAVGFAESDSPLGPFVKPDDTYLQNMICGVPTENPGDYISNRYRGFQTGTGHASICKVGDEYLLAYHAHLNRDAWGVDSPYAQGSYTEWRALGMDYLYFGADGRPYCNGPTFTLQKLPDVITGYKNLAPSATVTIDGNTTPDCAFINDRYTNRAVKTAEVNKEAQFSAGTHVITLKLPEAKLIKAVNVYNSYDREKSTTVISRIEFGNIAYVKDLKFNLNYLVDTYVNQIQEYTMNFIYPHAAYNIELTNKGVTTDTVNVIISCDHAFAIGEIEILGK
ncbi:MAG: family 43 glycosylhydrolase [Clostridiales bacterium]|nr:family 43 glycosylhydrolase [Clostridiales bacterium]